VNSEARLCRGSVVAAMWLLAQKKGKSFPSWLYPRHCLYVRDLVLCRQNGEGRFIVALGEHGPNALRARDKSPLQKFASLPSRAGS
jgi:hypothetical protein